MNLSIDFGPYFFLGTKVQSASGARRLHFWHVFQRHQSRLVFDNVLKVLGSVTVVNALNWNPIDSKFFLDNQRRPVILKRILLEVHEWLEHLRHLDSVQGKVVLHASRHFISFVG